MVSSIRVPNKVTTSFLLIFLIFSIKTQAQSNLLLPSKQIVAYQIETENPPEAFYNELLEALLDGSAIATNLLNESGEDLTAKNLYNAELKIVKLSYDELMALGRRKTRIMLETSPGVFIDSIITTEGSWKNGLSSAIFYETWDLNKAQNSFTKEVKYLSPVYTESYNGVNRSKLLCVTPFNYSDKEVKHLRKKANFVNRVSYTYNFLYRHASEKPNAKLDSPFLNNIILNRLLDYMLSVAKSGKITPYDYYTQSPINANTLTERLQTRDTISVVMRPGVMRDTVIVVPYDETYFKSLVFIEDWYVNKSPFMIFKDVVGIAPVYDLPNGDTEKKEIPFVLYFDESKID